MLRLRLTGEPLRASTSSLPPLMARAPDGEASRRRARLALPRRSASVIACLGRSVVPSFPRLRGTARRGLFSPPSSTPCTSFPPSRLFFFFLCLTSLSPLVFDCKPVVASGSNPRDMPSPSGKFGLALGALFFFGFAPKTPRIFSPGAVSGAAETSAAGPSSKGRNRASSTSASICAFFCQPMHVMSRSSSGISITEVGDATDPAPFMSPSLPLSSISKSAPNCRAPPPMSAGSSSAPPATAVAAPTGCGESRRSPGWSSAATSSLLPVSGGASRTARALAWTSALPSTPAAAATGAGFAAARGFSGRPVIPKILSGFAGGRRSASTELRLCLRDRETTWPFRAAGPTARGGRATAAEAVLRSFSQGAWLLILRSQTPRFSTMRRTLAGIQRPVLSLKYSTCSPGLNCGRSLPRGTPLLQLRS
mmetsp:Transcript_43343/g.119910  ORF Transcript_43343/g.119910 Transcript_43343/m.119910 type:complete len:423 (+) Transcript_43343:244-1512(+)